MDDTIEDLNVSAGEVKERILDTQSLGNMEINPPIEFDITILEGTSKDIYMQHPAKADNQKQSPFLRFLALNC